MRRNCLQNDLDSIYDAISSGTKEVESANVITDSSVELQYSQTYNVHLPKPEEQTLIKVSDINRIAEICDRVKDTKFSFAELFLGLSSLLIGAFLSAIVSQVHYEFGLLSIFLYTICPCAGIGFGVAYIFCRKQILYDAKQLAEKITDCLDKYLDESKRREIEH